MPEIVSSLKDNDVKGANITVKAAPSLDKQSQSVQDYVVNHVNSTSDDADSSDKTTLVVAPVADTTESDRQYGDYVSHAITWNGSSSDEDAQDYAQSAERFGFRIAARSKRGHESRVSVEHAAGFHSGCVRADDHGRADRPASSQNSWSASSSSTKPAPTIRSISKCYSPTMPPMKAAAQRTRLSRKACSKAFGQCLDRISKMGRPFPHPAR